MIRGEKTILRALEATDAEALHKWVNDEAVVYWLGRRLPHSEAMIREWLEDKMDPARGVRLGIATAEGQLIGWCDLSRWDIIQDNAVLTIAIGDRDYWGGGYGTDATLTVCCYGFAELNLNRVGLFVYKGNAPAVRVYEKCGFRHEGCIVESSYRHGQRQDLLVMGILRREFIEKWPERWERMCGSGG